MAELADALDSKSSGKPCGFESDHRYQTKNSQLHWEFFVVHPDIKECRNDFEDFQKEYKEKRNLR